MPTTIVDIARACGTSKTTVSKVLNGNDQWISEEKRSLIRDTMRRMNYRPSAIGRALSNRRTDMIGVITPMYTHLLAMPYFSMIVDSMLDELAKGGQTLAMFKGNFGSPAHPDSLVATDGRCDGLIVLTGYMMPQVMAELSRSIVPIVSINGGETEAAYSTIEADNFAAGRIATRHLIDLGHRNIAYLHSWEKQAFSVRRYEGHCAALREAELPIDPRLEVSGSYAEEKCHASLLRMLEDRPEVTAIFCAIDEIALLAIQTLRDVGKRVPADISVIGMNGESWGEVLTPRLTTVSQRLGDLGTRVVTLLNEQIDDLERPAQHLTWDVELIVRETTAPPKIH